MSISNVFELITGIALFLFGMSLMGEGLKKVAGSKLELILYRLSSTPLKGILLGTGVTAVIQSSCATSVMVVGFVNSNMMKLRQAIGVIMGSIIGTSITGWIICLSSVKSTGSGIFSILSTDTIVALIAAVGVVMRMFSKKEAKKHLADIMLGFAVLMFGISTMSEAVYPLRESETFISMLTAFSNPFLGILIGTIFTAILQSASAACGILQALAITGAIDFEIAFPIIMGIAIGAALPILLSGIGASAEARRSAWSYLFITVFGVVPFCIIFYAINSFVTFPFSGMVMTTVSIAALNSIFRIINIIMVAPFIKGLEKFLRTFVKSKPGEEIDLSDFDRLEDRFLEHPALAIEQTRLTIQSMAKLTLENFKDAIALFEGYTEAGFNKVVMLEDVIDRYEDKIGNYLVKIIAKQLDNKQNRQVSEYLHTLTDLERISDHALNIAESLKKNDESKISYSKDGNREIKLLVAAVNNAADLAIDALINDDKDAAYEIEPLEQVVDDLCDELKIRHIIRIRDGKCTYEHGFTYNDLLTDLERVSDHCSNVGLAVLELDNESIDSHEYSLNVRETMGNEFDEKYYAYKEKYGV